jgi:acetyl esterase/lipase
VKPLFRSICLAVAAVSIVGIAATAGIAKQAAAPAPTTAAKPPSAEDFGREAAIRNVSLSPDGKHIAALTSRDGVTNLINIWSTDAMDKPPVVLGCGDRSQCYSVSFVKNDRIAVTVRQQINEGNDRGHLFRFFITDLEGKVWRNADGTLDQSAAPRARVVSTLPKDPKNILIQIIERRVGTRSEPDRAFYKLNVYTGAQRKVFTGSDKFSGEQIDLDGNFRARQSLGYEGGKAYIAQWLRAPGSDQWVEHFRWYAKDRDPKNVVGFSTDPNIAYVQAYNGRDKAAIYEYDINARKFGEIVFEHKLFEAVDVRQSGAAHDYGRLLGFAYQGENYRTYWTDEKLAALTKGVRKALGVTTVPVQWTDDVTGEKVKYATPDGFDVELTDWADDMKYAIVVKVGPRQPAEYYLLTDTGQLFSLGKTRPWFDVRTLGDGRLVQYPARDGLMIPGFLYTPRKDVYGPGPYPTIIVPHGGPWARDDLDWDFSGWTQYFAARGYAVLQPQYRGSEGWGQKLWKAGDNEWGQKMQDDKDDGAKWLVAQGIADPNRIAMHGYSYGGYAAMAASVRPNGIYQCAVAGAGPSSMAYMQTRTSWSSFSDEFQGSTISGLSPLDHARDVSIPIFLYHGDRDTNVPISQSEKFLSALKGANKDVQWLELKDMGHSYNTWEPGQTGQVLSAVETYLRTKCGPGGL